MPKKILSIREALSSPLRRRIVLELLESPGMSARQLAKKLGIGTGNLAGHLLILERVGLIREVKNGRKLELYVNEHLLVNSSSSASR